MAYFPKYFIIFLFASIIFNANFIKNVNAIPLEDIDCSWHRTLDNIFKSISKGKPEAHFYLSTKNQTKPVEVGVNDWSGLKRSGFNRAKKSIVIIHGWRSSSSRQWILDMTENLHLLLDVNIFLVDWAKSCSSLNYFQVVDVVPAIGDLVANFFKALRIEMKNYENSENDELWQHLYFIGHSLGAHVSGRSAYLLKNNGKSFWKIERITGLDPTKPCFVHTDTNDHHNLDKSDADFVDVIHSNAGLDSNVFSFGLNQRIGHVDFYVDGGTGQPKCENWEPFENMICSHKLSYKFYIQSLNTTKNTVCKLFSHYWDGNATSILKLLDSGKNHEVCTDCPELGINAIDSSRRGSFVVLASELKPDCPNYTDDVKKAIEVYWQINFDFDAFSLPLKIL